MSAAKRERVRVGLEARGADLDRLTLDAMSELPPPATRSADGPGGPPLEDTAPSSATTPGRHRRASSGTGRPLPERLQGRLLIGRGQPGQAGLGAAAERVAGRRGRSR